MDAGGRCNHEEGEEDDEEFNLMDVPPPTYRSLVFYRVLTYVSGVV